MFYQTLNRTMAVESADKCRFLSLVTLNFEVLTLTFNLVRARDQIHLPSEFGADLFSEIFHTRPKNYRLTAPKTETTLVHCVR